MKTDFDSQEIYFRYLSPRTCPEKFLVFFQGNLQFHREPFYLCEIIVANKSCSQVYIYTFKLSLQQ